MEKKEENRRLEEEEQPAAAPRRRYTVGYALAPKKQRSFIQPSLLSSASSRGIDLVAIDPSLPLAAQGPFDLVLHKITTADWAAQLRDFTAAHPSVPVLDPPHAISRLHNRISMLQVVSELQIPSHGDTFGIPEQVVIYDSRSLSAGSSSVDGLRFPVIAKPLVADGSAKSHKMSLVFHRGDLLKLKPPIVLQEFVNHGGVIFKVFVVGYHVQCVKRKSLPDVLPEDQRDSRTRGPVSFSQVSNVRPSQAAAAQQPESPLLRHIEEAEMPPAEFLTEIAGGLRHALGLQLFNFDVIRDSKIGSHYLIVDINYFPGYSKMPCYQTAWTEFLWKALQEVETKEGSKG